MKRIFFVESDQTARGTSDEAVRQLDNLRSEFLLDLSHQLRTPVTAIKLAMDGLFSQIRDSLTPSQHDLANISRRNIERIVKLVENQLDLLQMMAGEREVCRRLTDLERLLRGLPRRQLDIASAGHDTENDCGRPDIELCTGLESGEPLYTFTDPDLLAAVVDCMLGVGLPNSRRHIRVDYDQNECVFQLDVSVDLPGVAPAGPANVADDPPPALDFESRAYRAMIDRLGGVGVTDRDDYRRWSRLRLPRYPEFDGEKDFRGPARRSRSTSEGKGPIAGEDTPAVHFVRCDLGEIGPRDYLAAGDGTARGFFNEVSAILSEEESVFRGPGHGSIYIALVNRTQEELTRVVASLRQVGDAGLQVWDPQTILAEEWEIERLEDDLQLV
jgi:hypothetical protein